MIRRYIEIAIVVLIVIDILKIIISYCMLQYRKKRISVAMKKRKVYMIIPVYHEQERIRECIASIEKIDWPKDKLEVCICTTEKEPIDGKDTHSLCEQLLKEKKYKFRYKIVRYMKTDGNMAEQVNCAYDHIDTESEIVCVYNADSVIQKDVLREVNAVFENPDINCVQQRAIYNNYSQNNVFSIGYCFYQSLFEIKNNLIKDFRNKGENVVGRALFFRKSFLPDYIYPTEFYCEDMALSFELICKKEIITSITQFEINEPPNNLRDIINQQYVWFHTASKIKEMVEYAKKRTASNKMNLEMMRKIFHRIIANISWMCISVGLIVLSIYNPLVVLLLYLYAVVVVTLADFMYRLRKKRMILFDAISYVLYLFVVSFGPLKYIFKKWAISLGMTLFDEKYKTPR